MVISNQRPPHYKQTFQAVFRISIGFRQIPIRPKISIRIQIQTLSKYSASFRDFCFHLAYDNSYRILVRWNICITYPFSLFFLNIVNIVTHSKFWHYKLICQAYGSGSRTRMECGSMQIRIRNTASKQCFRSALVSSGSGSRLKSQCGSGSIRSIHCGSMRIRVGACRIQLLLNHTDPDPKHCFWNNLKTYLATFFWVQVWPTVWIPVAHDIK